MSIPALSRMCRSYRRYNERFSMTPEIISEWMEAVRNAASGKNLQPLRFKIVTGRENCAKVFPLLGWAGYLKDWKGPAEGERPTGYIVICNDTTLEGNDYYQIDLGIAAQTLVLTATEAGYGGCMIMSFNKEKLAETCDIPAEYEPLMVVALGKPKEDARLVDMVDGDYKYYRDENGTHYVPKRSLDEITF